VSAFAATEVLSDEDRRPDPVTRWWKRREPCAICGEKMTLRGRKEGLFQGCDGHGYWLDADAIANTQLAVGVDEAKLQAKRDDSARVEAENAAREVAELEREKAKREKELREAAVAKAVVASPVEQIVLGTYQAEGTDSSEWLWAKLALTLGAVPATFLARRFSELEARNAALERRIAALEQELQSRPKP
jgi:hypothetical protein